MIVIYINAEGTVQVVSPSHIYQGSNQSSVTVFAPVPTTTALSIAFRLPDGTSTPYYPMTYIQNSDGLSQYKFTIGASITQKAGKSAIALSMLYTDGRQTSQLIEFDIEPSVLPELPESIDENAYEIIMQYLQQDRSDITAIQGQINDIEETADNAQTASANAVATANEAKSTADGLADSIAQANTNASQAVNTANEAKATAQEAENTANGFAESIEAVRQDVENIESYIPSGTSQDNQLTNKDFVNSSINNMAAFYISYNANGDAFPTRESLINATTFYSGGQVRVPTQNDYAIVLADESQPVGVDGSYPTTRYSYQGGTYPNGQWDFQYVVNNTSFTQAQVDALNSGITKAIVDDLKQGQVTSVNGQTGAAVITPANIGASTVETGNKNLYNLGIFDTFSSNGDGTGTIIRGTRYVALDGSEDEIWNVDQTRAILGNTDNLLKDHYGDFNSAVAYPYLLNNQFQVISYNAGQGGATGIAFSGSSNNLSVYGSGKTTEATWREFLSKNPLVIQYRINATYTEKVIEDQPIHTLPQDGEQWLREEWEKGLNYWNPEWTPYTEFTTTGNTSYSLTWEISANPDGYTNAIFTASGSTTGRFFYPLIVPSSGIYYSRMGYNGNASDDKHVTPIYLEAGYYTLSVDIAVNTTNRIVINNTIMMSKGATHYPYSPYYGKIARVNIGNNVLQTDPTKLEPTTANGWTIGGSNLFIPENGIYLANINNAVYGILVISYDVGGIAFNACATALNQNSTKNISYIGSMVGSNKAATWGLGSTSGSETVNTVAYKKLA